MKGISTNMLLLFAVVLLLLGAGGRGARSHDIYHDWKTESGVSCCNDQDCAPVRAQFVDDHWEIWHGNVWRIVPDRAVRPIKSPDGRSHACVFMGNILCFVPGEVRS